VLLLLLMLRVLPGVGTNPGHSGRSIDSSGAATSLSDKAVWYSSFSVAKPGGGHVPGSLGGLGNPSIDIGPA